MGIGGIFVSFGVTVIIIGLFARHASNTRAEFPTIATLATVAVVGGAVMFGAGYLLHRMARDADASREARRTAA
jgi:biotin transporter BioY